jgi:hypothetical protein
MTVANEGHVSDIGAFVYLHFGWLPSGIRAQSRRLERLKGPYTRYRIRIETYSFRAPCPLIPAPPQAFICPSTSTGGAA